MKKYQKSPLFKMSPAQKKARNKQRRIYKQICRQIARYEKNDDFNDAVNLDIRVNHYRKAIQHSKPQAEHIVRHMIEHYKNDAQRVRTYKVLWARKKNAKQHGNHQLASLIDSQMDAFRKINKHDPRYRAKMARRKRVLHRQHNLRYEAKHPYRHHIQAKRMQANPRTRAHYFKKIRQFDHDAYVRAMHDPVKHAKRKARQRCWQRHHYYDLKYHHPKQFSRYKAELNGK